MWLVFTLLTGAIYTAESLLTRHFLRVQKSEAVQVVQKDAWALSFFYSLVGTIVSLPFMLTNPKLPSEPTTWLLVVAIGLVIVFHNLLDFKAASLLEATFNGALSRIRLAWVFIFGLVVLTQPFSWQKLAGTIAVIAAGLVVVHYSRHSSSMRGIAFAVSSSLLNAGIIIAFKYLLDDFNAVSLTFFVAFLPVAIFNLILMPRAVSRIKAIFKADWRPVLVICSLGAFANLTLILALSLHDATSVLVVMETFLILVLVGEHIILKEKEQLWVKITAVVLAIIGAVLIQIGG